MLIKKILFKKILIFFLPLTYINFFSNKNNFIVKKIRNIYYKALEKHDLEPIQKVKKTFTNSNYYVDIFIDTHDFSNVGQVIDPNWEADLFNYYKKINNKNIIFIDLGGNIGCHSLYVLKYINFKKIIYLEPNKKCFELFNTSLSIQNLDRTKDVMALNRSISHKAGTSILKYFKNNSGSGSLVDYFGKKSKSDIINRYKSQFNYYNSENITFDELFNDVQKHDSIIIKMDIQGYEPNILSHLYKYIDKYNISHCFFEVNEIEEKKMLETLKIFKNKYFLKNLNNKIVESETIYNYLKKILVLEKKL